MLIRIAQISGVIIALGEAKAITETKDNNSHGNIAETARRLSRLYMRSCSGTSLVAV